MIHVVMALYLILDKRYVWLETRFKVNLLTGIRLENGLGDYIIIPKMFNISFQKILFKKAK